jgi:hypothetical protein
MRASRYVSNNVGDLSSHGPRVHGGLGAGRGGRRPNPQYGNGPSTTGAAQEREREGTKPERGLVGWGGAGRT